MPGIAGAVDHGRGVGFAVGRIAVALDDRGGGTGLDHRAAQGIGMFVFDGKRGRGRAPGPGPGRDLRIAQINVVEVLAAD